MHPGRDGGGVEKEGVGGRKGGRKGCTDKGGGWVERNWGRTGQGESKREDTGRKRRAERKEMHVDGSEYTCGKHRGKTPPIAHVHIGLLIANCSNRWGAHNMTHT
jgi:hypothetical protein